MFAPLSEYIENKLDESFCEEYRVYGTYERPSDWEEYKKAFASFLVDQFKGDSQIHPKRPKNPWG
ncbi:hypothetical protein CMI47_01995 [Candidatus Pacearchaeota archaeon]|jgi:hypothetical protein|nr:hypothetical protein [Candidatus Pacearchaeota archaeon]|tara:strand:+ start:2095 stop:2289 length:195 start_codon:yes stop_codon:yes gene_type:complete